VKHGKRFNSLLLALTSTDVPAASAFLITTATVS
jgi:hypothetical protein